MRFDFDLNPKALQLMKDRKKTVELRLNDEKRRKIRVSDLVFFHNCDNEYDVIRCRVVFLKSYPDFRSLYRDYSPLQMGYEERQTADPDDMLAYYSREKIARYGVLAIGIEYLDDLYLADGHMHLEYGPLSEEYALSFIEEGIRKGLDEVDILDHTHRFVEFERCYEHLRVYPQQDSWLKQKTKFCNTLEDYAALIDAIRKKDLPIRVRFGLEVCYSSNTQEMLSGILKDVKLDFLTGAIHSIDSILYDMSFSKELLWDRYSADHIFERYYEEVLALIASGLFDRLAHPDQIKMMQIYPDCDLSKTYHCIAAALKKADMYAENNTGIFYRYHHPDPGLSPQILKIFREEGVKLISASDAHKSSDVGIEIERASLRNRGDIE